MGNVGSPWSVAALQHLMLLSPFYVHHSETVVLGRVLQDALTVAVMRCWMLVLYGSILVAV